jgi:GNAT superfamily N-acetyltransferase
MAMNIHEPDVDTFIELAWQLNAHDPSWIPPMRARLQQELTGADAFGRYGRLRLFGCESDGRLVGRLAAIVNPRLVDPRGHPVGQVGYFEAINDSAVASALFDAAFEWLRAAGARQVWGPMNGGPHRTHRFITDGFDRTPFLFEPRNPPYYPHLFEASGFSRLSAWYSIDVTSDNLRQALASQPMLRVRNQTHRRFEVERIDTSDAPAVLRRLHALLDAMWTGHVGYTSLDFAEFVEVFAPGLSLMTTGDMHIAIDRASGRDVGCVFSYPDYAAEVRGLAGDASAWAQWLQSGARPRRLVLHTVGMAPDVRRTGLASALVRSVFEHCVEGYEEGVIAIVVEDLAALQKVGPPTRRYALFGRLLD